MNAIEEYELKGAEKARREFVIDLLITYPEISNATLRKLTKLPLKIIKEIRQEFNSKQ